MGVIDYFQLGSTGGISIITLLLLLLSLKSTNDEVKKRSFKKYMFQSPFVGCAIVFYFACNSTHRREFCILSVKGGKEWPLEIKYIVILISMISKVDFGLYLSALCLR
jgi:hypothetical protein